MPTNTPTDTAADASTDASTDTSTDAGAPAAGEPAAGEPAEASATEPTPTPAATATPAPAPGSATTPGAAPAPKEAREHRFDIDLLRLIASCAVIVTHTCAALIHAVDQQRSAGEPVYWAGFVGDSATSFAVPVFFAIAGWAVVAGAPPKTSGRLWQRLIRNTVPMFVWTALYLAWAWARDRNEDPIVDLAVDSLFDSVQPAYHLWFMYAYLPIVVMLGFVVLLRAGQRPWGLGLLLLALAGLGPALTTVHEVTGWETPRVGWGFGTYSVIYAIGGAFLLSAARPVPRRWRWPLVGTALAAVAGIVWYNTDIHYVIPNAHPFVAVLSACVILLLVRVRVPERRRALVNRLANAALGAYLVHVILVEELVDRYVEPDLSVGQVALFLPAMLAVTVGISYAASLLWGRLGLRRYLG
ncbi:acyltransferase family protein [Streptomyces sp. 3MP-14]|uniref:Acyltransferase family protein n=1 Tax=Streptomyces mimosae TaxID=2586635 RepID=A0A5N5ZRN8_9ACTN|nr:MULTISPECIES: acyltransferase [Streptomyces]KAB8158386.1 acyltransferase family protein [Streptomyces mimosae]KAB8172579.1 acyltransferase family protein [Streptomyces sp. 3MP-14]